MAPQQQHEALNAAFETLLRCLTHPELTGATKVRALQVLQTVTKGWVDDVNEALRVEITKLEAQRPAIKEVLHFTPGTHPNDTK